jgi:hypothetical protein
MDVRDAVAEMAARAQEISIEAGSKMTGALRDVIHAAAGISNFALESARDLTAFFVKRGQMTQDDADRLLREAEDAAVKKKPVTVKAAPAPAPAKPAKPVPLKQAVAAKQAAVAPAAAPAPAKAAPKKPAAKAPAKPAPKKPAAKPAKKK